MTDPETATDEQIEVELINVAIAYIDCRQRHADLVTFVRSSATSKGRRISVDIVVECLPEHGQIQLKASRAAAAAAGGSCRRR